MRNARASAEHVAIALPVVAAMFDRDTLRTVTGRTRDVRAGGAAVDLDAPAPPSLSGGDTIVLSVAWGDRHHRHLARVVGVDAGGRHLRLAFVKPECGFDQAWVDAVVASSHN